MMYRPEGLCVSNAVRRAMVRVAKEVWQTFEFNLNRAKALAQSQHYLEVAVTWGPGAMQSIYVTSCPVVGVTIWRIVETLKACPNPPCDDGTNPAP